MSLLTSSVGGPSSKARAKTPRGARGSETIESPLVKESARPPALPSRLCAWREPVHRFFDDPSSSVGAKIVSLWITALIILSCGAFILKTLPQFYLSTSPVWEYVEIFSVINFTIEYTIRLFTCANFFQFVLAPLNIIDLIAILPWYIEKLLHAHGAGMAFVRVARLARMLRLFKLSKYSAGLQLLGETMSESIYPLGLLSFFLVIGVIIFSCVIYIAESGEWNEELGTFLRADGSPSPYSSIPASFWWCIITMTTVGYGDVFPITPLGKVIASFAAICGILVLALPITVIGNNFTAQMEKLKQKQKGSNEKAAAELTVIATDDAKTRRRIIEQQLVELEKRLREQQTIISGVRSELLKF